MSSAQQKEVSEDYVWETLDGPTAFRLLQLHGYDARGRIICSLVNTNIDVAPSYTAISYSWGIPKLDQVVICDDNSLAVTSNVYALFSQLIQKDEINKMIWVDAVCIDQSNLTEREQQVRLMKDIFSGALLTIVWLGEPKEPGLVPSMLELGENIIAMTKKVSPRILKSEELEGYGLPTLDHHSWKMLAEFFCLSWFQRVWTTQEYVLAKDVIFMYGQHWKPSSFYVAIIQTFVNNEESYHLEELLRLLVSRPQQSVFWSNNNIERWLGISTRLSLMDLYRSLRKMNADYQNWALRTLIRRSSTTRTTDLRDYIYGLLGILPEYAANHPDVQPDYHQSHEIAYIKLARFVLETEGLATLLSSVGFPRSALTRPSWVPDWSQNRLSSSIHRQAMLSIPSTYGRNEYAPWRLEDAVIPQKLFVRGIILDSIKTIESMLEMTRSRPEMPYSEGCFKFIMNTQALMMTLAQIGESAAALAMRHLTTLCLGPHSDLEDSARFVAPFYDFQNLHVLLDNADLTRQISQRLATINVSDTSWGFFLTENGEIGRASHETKLKDKICFFQGINIPFIVRNVEGSSNEYIILDHCYVDGHMNGKFWDQHDPENAHEICLV